MIPVMIDSGAYSAMTLGETIDLDEYIAFLHELRPDFPEAVFIALDVIGDEDRSLENWKEMRRQGLETLPVFHPLPVFRPAILAKYLDETDYVALGSVAGAAKTNRERAIETCWRVLTHPRSGLPIAKVHGMGVSGFTEVLRIYPWYSVDSSTWMRPGTFGWCRVPPRKAGGWDFSRRPKLIKTDLRKGWEEQDSNGKVPHYLSLSSQERVNLQAYFRELEIPLGFESRDESGCRVTLKGVTNSLKYRSIAGIEYVARCSAELHWPRAAKIRAGLNTMAALPPVFWGKKIPPCTTYYLSGTPYSLDVEYVLPRRDRMPHIGVLSSYFYLKDKKCKMWRDLQALGGKR